ncbi:serine/threonine-protein kinase [Streptomyces sp. VMFN-G11Ma]|uniref:serine/threonine-protein kinase n=1 Tax=Streptomyces sp. VMFN-G11Ma TaxID=2135609 RepID=UPI000D3C533C|nr:serine/threonine-protein kinase [Streptomyces sp. VMFN-G11Ma]PTM93881.1 serine/threonine protein kinase [Streptomyces sp. VMFN-G11Ma]
MNNATEVFQPLQGDDPRTVAGYRLAARLGAGGMGRVYLSHTRGGRPVAIKVVRPELADDPAFRRRFGREIKAARRVRGAYTAELIDADADGAPPWLATLYVPGPSLAEAVARRGPLPVPAVLWLMAGVAEALQAIHGAGIVHRDLKPSNVLLAADGPRVIDFGISLAADATWHTSTGSAVGTPQFMAPEQATAGEVTPATDMFALGQTAAFAALGEPLYGDGPSATVLYRIVHSEPELTLLPEQLRPLIARCLAADPGERATPAEVLEWCRQRLGRDADAGGGPAVWREVAGTEVTVPAPVPDPTRTHTVPADRTGPDRTRPLLAQPHLQTRPTAPDERTARRRRTALTVTAVVVGLALLTGLTLWLRNLPYAKDHRGTAASSSTPGAERSGAARSSASASPAGDDAHGSGDSGGGGGGAAKEAGSSPTAARTPQAEPHPQQWIDEKTSLSFKEPFSRKDRKGDIRFDCKQVGCALESDTSVLVLVYGRAGTSLDDCRLLTSHAHSHHLPLAAAANGSEICVKNSSGDIALLVIQTKSTALWDKPGISFMTADMTIWRKAQGQAGG